MYGHRTSSLNKTAKQGSAHPVFPTHHSSNPFDSDDEADNRQRLDFPRRASERVLATRTVSNNPFDDDSNIEGSTPSNSLSSAKSRYKNDFRDAGGLENQTMQELENYSLYKAEKTTKTVNNCLRIAEEMREGATKTLATLHQQGDQITRTHAVAADIDHDLSRGEKLLGSLGGIFSRTWRPKKTREIVGPVMMRGFCHENCYIGNAQATSKTLVGDGWLRTGDLCYIDDEGFLLVVDRLKELIKYKGYQVAPAELEQLLQSHPDIIDAAVIPYHDEEAGEVPMACVVKRSSRIDEAQVMDFTAKQVAPYKKIRRVWFVSSIPRTASGKILRKELRKAATLGSLSNL